MQHPAWLRPEHNLLPQGLSGYQWIRQPANNIYIYSISLYIISQQRLLSRVQR